MNYLAERVQPESRELRGHTTPAPRGKPCTRCLCCPAAIVFEGEALCEACDDGTHPPMPETALAAAPVPAAPAPAPQPEPHQPEPPEPEKEKPMTTSHTYTDEQKEAIRSAPASESTRALARRLDLKTTTVHYHRKKAQRGVAPSKPGRKPGAGRAAAHPAPQVIPRQPVAPIDGEEVRAAFDCWWNSLPLATKAGLFAHNFIIPVEGSVK